MPLTTSGESRERYYRGILVFRATLRPQHHRGGGTYESGRLGFPNTFLDPVKSHVLYNQYHEHYSSYWCMKPEVNLDAALISKVTKKVKIAMLGNVIAVTDSIQRRSLPKADRTR